MQKSKDYYRILNVSSRATQAEIRKAYRQLAHRYHPDKGGADTAFFLEIKEAYDVLHHPHRRALYDEERWLSGHAPKQAQEALTPEWIGQQTSALLLHMSRLDTYRMNHRALQEYVLDLLNDAHIALLRREGNGEVNRLIVKNILGSVRNIDYVFFPEIAERVCRVADADNELSLLLRKEQRRKQRFAAWHRYKPAVILLIALVLTGLMIWYVQVMQR